MDDTASQITSDLGEVKTQFFTFADERRPFNFRREQDSFWPVTLAYETYGRLNAGKSNAILLFHALSGSQHAAGINRSVREDIDKRWTEEMHIGWWDEFIGPGKALDTDQYFVICANYLGGCYGSSGPASINPATGQPYAKDFPTVMFSDIVDSQVHLLDHFKIKKLHAVIGGSLGGLCAINFSARYPDRVEAVVSIASGVETSIQQRISNFEQITAIEDDKHYKGGNYYEGHPPNRGLALARMISHKNYISLDAMEHRAKNTVIQPELDKKKWYWIEHKVESYLRKQGLEFVERFDANTYLRIVDAWQKFDLLGDTGASSFVEMFKACSAQRHLVFTITDDDCFSLKQQEQICSGLQEAGVPFQHVIVHSLKGHDSFLVEPELYTASIAYFLQGSGNRDAAKRAKA